jgi:hypothetical protein
MTNTSKEKISNDEIANFMERIADLLDSQDGNPHRIRAYRSAAKNIRDYDQSIAHVVKKKGQEALEDIPGIGSGLAGSIGEFARSGRLNLLDRLEGEVSPENLFMTIPGIGEKLAERIHQELDIEKLEELEMAAHDGRLEQLEGFSTRKVQGIRDSLAGILSRSARRRSLRYRMKEDNETKQPPVKLLLEVDKEYRKKAETGKLKTIKPKRFNPEGKKWLPILHSEKDGWSFTVLYSNTARAHEWGKINDWVVIYFERDGADDQCTVVTEERGSLAGKRVVRGLEAECDQYYQSRSEYLS